MVEARRRPHILAVTTLELPDTPGDAGGPASRTLAESVLLGAPNHCTSQLRFTSHHSRLTQVTSMAQTASFDVTTGVDLQEVDNAINQAQKEIAQRYDFKGSKATIEFKRAEKR